MANGRITQGGVAVLARLDSNANGRVTQAGVQVLARLDSSANARVTQGGVQVLVALCAPARVTQAGIAVLARKVACVTQSAQCWIISRNDGVTQGFTSLDVPILVEGVLCSPCDSLSASALELSSEIGAVGNQEVTGVISDDAISSSDLLSGRYDDALVEVWKVAWLPDPQNASRAIRDPAQTPRRLTKGRMGRVTQSDHSFNAEVLTDGAALEQTAITELYTKDCRFRQYGERCGLNREDHLVSGAVTGLAELSVYSAATRRVFFDSSRTEVTDTFSDARQLTWLTGDNAGAVSHVKSWDLDLSQFTLWEPLPNSIQIGDTYEVAEACGQSESGCRRLGNFLRFGGFLDVPGQDHLIQTPDATVG